MSDGRLFPQQQLLRLLYFAQQSPAVILTAGICTEQWSQAGSATG